VIIAAGTIRIGAGKRAQALAAFQRVIEATRREAGCVDYSFAFDVLDDHLIRIFEIYRDAEALAAHRASAHFAAWRASNPELGVSARNLIEYDISASRKAP
jgi:quinol monooxygenase YgiN